jgi:hypothetical protein
MQNLGIAIFVFGLTGTIGATWSLASAYLELSALIVKNLNGPKKFSALSNVICDAFTLSAQVVIMLAGLEYVHIGEDRGEAVSWLVVSALMTMSLIVNRIRRVRVGTMWDQIQKEGQQFHHRRATDSQ